MAFETPILFLDNGEIYASSTDATFGYLYNKLVAGSNVTISLVSGADEKVQIAASGSGGGSGYQTPTSGAVNGSNQTFVASTVGWEIIEK